jgi:DNA-binding MarR family transcriptional regulator
MKMTSRSDAPAGPPQWLHGRLQTLLRFARVSEAEYHHATGLPDLERRLISLIGAYKAKAASSAQLVAFTGLAKAQISHAIKSLDQAGLIRRESLRAPIGLSARGQKTFVRIMAVITHRNSKLVEGIDAASQQEFWSILMKVTDRAALMFAQEQALSEGVGSDIPRSLADPPSGRMHAGLVDDTNAPILLPTLTALASYVKRSTSLVYKRETGIADFDWQILSQIAEVQPLTLAQLIGTMARDKAQVGRTVQKLADSGLIVRQSARNKREVSLRTTDAGNRACRLIYYNELRFDSYLFEEFPVSDRQRFMDFLERIIDRARQL